MKFFEEITSGLTVLGLPATQSECARLVAFLGLLHKWNKVFRLTAIDQQDWAKLHILDSLSVLPYINGQNVADVGSGAGFPGIPIAVLRPRWSVTLIESNGKKASFLTQALLELELQNVQVFSGRVEDYQPSSCFDWVIARAFADLGKFARNAGHLCGYSGKLAAMKAMVSKRELEDIGEDFEVEKIIHLNSVDRGLQRNLILIRKSTITLANT